MGMWIIAKVFLYKPTQTGNDQKKSYGITNKITTELTAEGRYWMIRRKPERFIRFHVRAKRCSNPRTDLLSCVASATWLSACKRPTPEAISQYNLKRDNSIDEVIRLYYISIRRKEGARVNAQDAGCQSLHKAAAEEPPLCRDVRMGSCALLKKCQKRARCHPLTQQQWCKRSEVARTSFLQSRGRQQPLCLEAQWSSSALRENRGGHSTRRSRVCDLKYSLIH